MADTKISALGELSAVPATDDFIPILDVSDTTMDASGTDKKISRANLIGSTEVIALIVPQMNFSSIGDTYTDTTGDTYAETTNQTRITVSNSRKLVCARAISGHVSAGTGSFELYNFTDSASLQVGTTTSTTEALVTRGTSEATTNNGDAITMRVKNSGAGGTITIDAGGIYGCDGHIKFNLNGVEKVNWSSLPFGGWLNQVQFGVLKHISTATLTAQLLTSLATSIETNFGSSFGTADANTIITINPTTKIFETNASTAIFRINITAVAGTWQLPCSYSIKQDNI